MDVQFEILSYLLLIVITFLLVKIYLLRKAAQEIKAAFADRLETDTNTLIALSSRDRQMRALADDINAELQKLRSERLRFQQGDMEIREAVTNISHDLRTPLTAVFGYLTLMEQEEKTEAMARYTGIIRNRAEALKQLTEELFSYTIAASETEILEVSSVSLNAALAESISVNYAAIKGCRITPEISIPETEIIRYLNKHSLSRIFGNILSNAMKYSDGDLSISLTEKGEIIFANHAQGLDEVQVGKLFDRFFTVEDAKKSTGLGLSIAKILTEQMGGTITAVYKDERVCISLLFPDS